MATHKLPDTLEHPFDEGIDGQPLPCPRRAFIKNLAESNRLMVTFMKNDGTFRVMKCTLNYNLIPKEHRPNDSVKGRYLDDAPLRVYDLEKRGWRSFWADSIIGCVSL
jgi:hypothetical protein